MKTICSISGLTLLFSFFLVFLAKGQLVPESEIIVEELSYKITDSTSKKLIIAYPKLRSTPLATIIHFHGGGFRQGAAERITALQIAQRGFIGISVSYRLSPEAIFPAAVHDCKTAIRWARANAEKYGIDGSRIGLFGGSAGGHLALITGLSTGDSYLETPGPYAGYPTSVSTIVAFYPPTDFSKMMDAPGKMDHDSPTSPESLFIGAAIQKEKAQVQKANPINYIDAQDPTVLVFHGKSDMSVPFNQSELLVEELKAHKVPYAFVPVENAGHGFKPSPADATISPSRDEINGRTYDWFRLYLK